MAYYDGKVKGHQPGLYSSSDVSSQSFQQYHPLNQMYLIPGSEGCQQQVSFPHSKRSTEAFNSSEQITHLQKAKKPLTRYAIPQGQQQADMPSTQHVIGVDEKRVDLFPPTHIPEVLQLPASEQGVVGRRVGSRGTTGEDIKCAICLEVYKDPHLLPCLHSFCKTCLIKLSTSSHRKIKCPTCRKEHSLSHSGVDGLLPNTYLANKVEEAGGSAVGPSRNCGQCNSLDVVIFCSQCNDFLCRQCHEAHKRMAAFSEHRGSLLPLSRAKKKRNVREYKCSQHPKELLQVYCVNCEVVICRDCALYSHQNHQFKPAENVAGEIKERLSSSCASLKEKSKIFQSHTETIAKVEQHITTYPDQLKTSIASTFDDLIRALHQRKQTLLNEVDTKYNSFSKVLWAEKNTVEMTLCSLQAGIKFADQLKEDSNNLEVAVLGAQAIKSMKKLHSVSWDSKPVKELGPLVYLRREKKPSPLVDDLQFIHTIGHVINVGTFDLQLTAKGYSQTAPISAQSSSWSRCSHHGLNQYFLSQGQNPFEVQRPSLTSPSQPSQRNFVFQRNGTFLVTANNLDGAEITMSAQVTLAGSGVIRSITSLKNDQWKITFFTAKVGNYEVKAEMKKGNELLRNKTITIHL